MSSKVCVFVGLAEVKAFSLLVFILNSLSLRTPIVLEARVNLLEGHFE